MRMLDLLIVFLSHLLAARGFWQALRRDQIPNTAEFAVISVIFYYDLGLALEALGYHYQSPYFVSLFQADDSTFVPAMLLLAGVPWLFQAGARLGRGARPRQPHAPSSTLAPAGRPYFYALVGLAAGALALYGLRLLLQGAPLWVVRLMIGLQWGPLIVVLYLPLHFLAFYVRQRDARTWRGLVFAAGLAGATILSTAVIGERTMLLLPFLIIALFRLRISLPRLAALVGTLIIIAATLLPVLRWQYAGTELGVGELVAETISADIARGGVLNAALNLAEPVGTRLLPYPLAGYVYSALFFVPRQVAPFKGGPTTQYFTGYLAGTPPEETGWALGVGVIEELLLNAGLLLVVPGLFLYGVAMGLLDRACGPVPALVVPSRLAAVWLCGYNLPAVLGLFGVMALVGVALHLAFARRLAPQPAEAPMAGAVPVVSPAP